MKNILLLCDGRGYLTSSLEKKSRGKINISLLKKSLEAYGFNVKIMCLHDLKFPSEFSGWFVLYPSSEDAGLFYKGFIEDIILRLTLDKAILLPKYELFRAHHNKVFMELYRSCFSDPEFQTIKTWVFYSYKDLKKIMEKETLQYPLVLKSSSGAGSAGVSLVRDEKELLKKAMHMGYISFSNLLFSKKDWFYSRLIYYKKRFLGEKPLRVVECKEKMVLQTFIPNLEYDYKVLVFGEKFYILRRKTRDNDFRASGSGKLEFPDGLTEKEIQVLDFAKKAYIQLDTPLLSIDIAYDGDQCHMLEFQCLNFGPYTLQYSNCYYKYIEDKWKEFPAHSILENEIALAINQYVERY